MINFLEFLKNIFSKNDPVPKLGEFALGAILNDPDNRDIPFPVVAGLVPEKFPAQIVVPNFLETQKFVQGNLATCVEHSLEFIKRSLDGVLHSRRVPYVITRNELGWTEATGQGLPQREAAKTATIVGMPKDTGLDDNTLPHKVYASLAITQEMRNDANNYKFGGFTFPVITENGIKQALAAGKMVTVTIAIDWSAIDPDGTVHPVKNQFSGYHEVVIGASDDLSGKFRAANWWGFDLYIQYNELQKVIFDAIVFTDLPDDLKLRAKAMQYIFTTKISPGDKNTAVGQLEKRMAAYGLYLGPIDNSFGLKLFQAIKSYQKFKGLAIDGILGPATRQALNDDSGNGSVIKSKLDLWIAAGTIMEGAKPLRNNPGNLRFVGQQFAINDNGFCKFDTFAHGYSAFRNLLIHACSGAMASYNPNGSLYDFYSVYAPASDGNDPRHYAEFVAKYIGVDPSIAIKNLIL